MKANDLLMCHHFKCSTFNVCPILLDSRETQTTAYSIELNKCSVGIRHVQNVKTIQNVDVDTNILNQV